MKVVLGEAKQSNIKEMIFRYWFLALSFVTNVLEATPIIAMRGHGGFGNQVYQYLGLAASMQVARESKLVNLTWGCEFAFRDSAVGPSDTHLFANLNRAFEYFTWPHDVCSARRSLSRPLDGNTTRHIEFSVEIIQRIGTMEQEVFLINTQSCMFHSKSLCFLRGIPSAEYWQALISLGSQVKLRQSGALANKNEMIMRSIDTQFINGETICVHLRGKNYEHHRDQRHKVAAVVDSVLLALESIGRIRERGMLISGITIITAMEVESAWNESLQRLSEKDKAALHEVNVAVMRGRSLLLAANGSELREVRSALDNRTTESGQLDNTELMYLDLLRMSQCPWLVLAEPLGRGSFSGSAVLWSGKQYCTSMPWMVCDPKFAGDMNVTTSVPWSDNELSRFMHPFAFHTSKSKK